ncbi:hypothetical protein AAG570_005034 [Ranatra chinensis]|uniref:C2H2-type domain-containing protein n=1 Tax=Ranatra chinensis TaxID=642074 RepID=A0ABD0Y075_9HEMI
MDLYSTCVQVLFSYHRIRLLPAVMEEPVISFVAVDMEDGGGSNTDEEDNAAEINKPLTEDTTNEGSCEMWDSSVSSSDGNHRYCCNKCGLLTTTRKELADHILEDHTQAQEQPAAEEDGQNKDNLPWDAYRGYKASGKQRERRFQCDLCGYKAGQPGHLASHKRMHIGDKWFVCSDCGYRTHTASHLRRHHHSVHSAERPYQCHFCDYATAQPYNLKHHMKRHFPKQERKYPCGRCSYKAVDVRALEKHSRKHEEMGDFMLGQWSSLVLGEQKHYEGQPRPAVVEAEVHSDESAVAELCHSIMRATQRYSHHQCADCGYVAVDSRDLASHRRTHRRILHCDHCGYRSQDPSNMKKHIMTHRPKHCPPAQEYPCHECNYVAESLSRLQKHWYRRHSHRYVCNDCGYSVVYRKQLVDHIKDEHDGEMDAATEIVILSPCI